MISDIQFHAELLYRAELIQNFGSALSLVDSYFGVERDPFGEEVDEQDD